MSNSVFFSGTSGTSRSFGSSIFFPMAQICFEFQDSTTTEAQAEIPYRVAGTISKFHIELTGNTLNGNSVITSRKNGAGGNLSITVPASTSGHFSDTANSDSIAAGDLVCWKFDSTASSSGLMTIRQWNAVFAASSNTACYHALFSGQIVNAASTTYYDPAAGRTQNNTTEANAQQVIEFAATEKKLYVYVQNNGRSTDTLIGNRINGADGTLQVTVGAAATGAFEDTSNSDSLAAGDLIGKYTRLGTGAGNFNYRLCCTVIESTSAKSLCGFGSANTVYTTVQPNTRYFGIGGAQVFIGPSSTESNTIQYVPVALTASKLYVNVTSNTCSASSTFRLRVNGADSALTISIGATTTGQVSDLTNSVDLAIADLVNYAMTAGGTGAENIRIRTMTMMLEDKTVVGSFRELEMAGGMREYAGGMRG